MKKRIVFFAMAVIMIVALMGCSVNKTVTRTETVTDANGNTTTTTTVTSNGNTTTTTVEETAAEPESEKTVATLVIANETGVDLYTLKFSSVLDDDWGVNLLDDAAPLEDGQALTFEDGFTYSANNTVWDMKIGDENDAVLEFRELDMTQAADPTNITIVLTYDEAAEDYTATVQ